MGMMQAADSFMVEPQSARIYVVDDDPAMQRLIVNYVNEHNMRAIAASGRQKLLQLLASKEPDLIILDLNLGDEDGLDLLREVRAKSIVPVILITGNRSEEIDRVVGLELGADDYITKPFSLRELLARVRAVLRRRSMDSLSPMRRSEQKYGFQGWMFDQRARRLHCPAGGSVSLTKGEFALLSAFVAAPRRPLSREHLLQATRVHEDVFDRSIDVQILRLRRKLEKDPSAPKLIRTERGVGYIFDTEVQIV
jgi:two-component system OmpR family response regulator